MSQERGSALLVAIVMMITVLVLHAGIAETASYTIGGGGGWTFNVDTWPSGRRFRAGDTLLFNYNSGIHNVVAVSKAGYDGCATSSARLGRIRSSLRRDIITPSALFKAIVPLK